MAGLKLDVGQWKALVLHDMAILASALQNAQAMDPAGLKWVDDRWAILRGQLMVGWEAYSRPMIQEQIAMQQQAVQPPPMTEEQYAATAVQHVAQPQPNGSELPKKKRADAGKPRGPRKSKTSALPAVTM